jgi:asparagine synthase (glutamine-hydrolysing)
MCGIFGWIAPRTAHLNEELLRRLTDGLTHRGPDGSGYWMSTAVSGTWQVALGHRRLAIIDLTDSSAQPMKHPSGKVIIFNGEIYNYIELRHALAARGSRFVSRGDTEVLLSLLAEDPQSIDKLRGMFAFALWDPGREELLLGRDQFGKKPLFIASLRSGGLAFSSEIGPLLAMPGVDRSLNRASLPDCFRWRFVPGPKTLFRGIEKLQPGHTALWRNKKFGFKRYYTPPVMTSRPRPAAMDEAAELCRNAISEAVALRLRSDAPFGAFLSGGIDSATVVATMAEMLPQPVRTFTAGFEEARFSELATARTVALQFGTDHNELVVAPQAIIEQLSRAVTHRGAPVSEASDIPIIMLSDLASKTVKMVLTGEGSDEFLAGYPKYRWDRFVPPYQRAVSAAFHERLVRPLLEKLPVRSHKMLLATRMMADRDDDSRARNWFSSASVSEIRNLFGPLPDERSAPSADPGFPVTQLRKMLGIDQTSWLPDNLLERGDRMMMAASIEGRMPFLDIEFAKVAASFPDHLLMSWLEGKRVLRRAMKHKLPHTVLSRRKMGFLVPIDDWFRGPLREYSQDTIRSKSSRLAELMELPKALRYVDDHQIGKRNHGRMIWMLLNLGVFMEVFGPETRPTHG